MAKLKFKKDNITDTVLNTAIGGAGNVVFDMAWEYMPDAVTNLGDTAKNAIKLIGGAVAGSMVSNKYLRALTNGFAVVGASDLISGLVTGNTETDSINDDPASASGLPHGTIGRVRMPQYGSPTYRRKAATSTRVSGLKDFMGD